MLKDHDLARRVEGGVQVLQKELFCPGAGVEGKVHDGQPVAPQKPPRGHAAGRLGEGEVPPRARCTAEEDDVPSRRRLCPQHKGAAHGPHDPVHEGVLPQHRLFHLSGQPLEAAQMLLPHLCRALGQQAVGLHLFQHLPALGKRLLRRAAPQRGVLLFEHLIEFFLLLKKSRVQVGQAGFLRRLLHIIAQLSSRAEHSVHQALPIIGVSHCACLRPAFFPV